jgi:hypothetical protein
MLEEEGGLCLLERLRSSSQSHALRSTIQKLAHQTVERCRRFRADSSRASSEGAEPVAQQAGIGVPYAHSSSDEDEPVAPLGEVGVPYAVLDFRSDDDYDSDYDYAQ